MKVSACFEEEATREVNTYNKKVSEVFEEENNEEEKEILIS